MKLSDKILLGFVGLAIAAVVAIVVALRIATTTVADPSLGVAAFSADSIAYHGEPFTRLEVSGAWNVYMLSTDSHSVAITRREGNNAKVKVYVENGTLYLVSSTRKLATATVTATIALPRIVSISTMGMVADTMTGLRTDSLRIATAGGSSIVGRQCRVNHLELNLGGFSEVNMKGSVIGGAHLDTRGGYGVKLTMDGGILSGVAAGMGGIDIFGPVGTSTLQTEGLVELSYHE